MGILNEIYNQTKLYKHSDKKKEVSGKKETEKIKKTIEQKSKNR